MKFGSWMSFGLVRNTEWLYTTTKVDYGDETFRHQIHMVTKQHSSPKLRHRMYWWRKCFVTNKKMIGDESFSSPNIFVTKPYFQWRNISSPNVFFFSTFNRLGDEVLCNRFDLIFFFNFLFIISIDQVMNYFVTNFCL